MNKKFGNMKQALKLTSNSRVFYLNFLIGRSILVSDLYLSNSGFADCLPSTRGMLTKRTSIVFATAPRQRISVPGSAHKTESSIPHHISISPR